MNPSFFLRISIAVCFVPVASSKVADWIRQVFFGKILPLAVWRFSRKPLWYELSIPSYGITFATGTYLTGVQKYLRRFAGRIATKWLAHLLATPEKTRVLDAKECVLDRAYYKKGS